MTRSDGRGFDVTPDANGWRWGLELRSHGFPGQERGVKQARALADVEKLSYQWDSLITEWFVNGDRGLEHGFTLASRPGKAAAALTLHLAVRGTLVPRVSPVGRRVSFLDDRGAPALNYAGLKVTDAQGRELAARFAREPGGLRLEVEERSARYPVTIDPPPFPTRQATSRRITRTAACRTAACSSSRRRPGAARLVRAA